MEHKRLSNVDEAKIISVIQVTSIRGEGTEKDPITQIIEYFLPTGERVARTTDKENIKAIHKWE